MLTYLIKFVPLRVRFFFSSNNQTAYLF